MTILRWSLSLALALSFPCTLQLKASDFPAVTQEELKMTSVPEQPGATAVMLQREEIDDDMNNVQTVHARDTSPGWPQLWRALCPFPEG
jgi:hypothetical protein